MNEVRLRPNALLRTVAWTIGTIGLTIGGLGCAADTTQSDIAMPPIADPASPGAGGADAASPAPDACFIDESFDSSWRPGGDRYDNPSQLIEAVREAALRMEADPQPVPGAADAEAALRRAEMVDSARRRALDHAVLIESDHERATWESSVGERLAGRFEARFFGEEGGWGIIVSWFQVPQAVCAIDTGDAQP